VELEQHMSCNLKEYKEFIDNEMLLILGQMDKATLIFDHLYLVRTFLDILMVSLYPLRKKGNRTRLLIVSLIFNKLTCRPHGLRQSF
jgi:hypothetical protein